MYLLQTFSPHILFYVLYSKNRILKNISLLPNSASPEAIMCQQGFFYVSGTFALKSVHKFCRCQDVLRLLSSTPFGCFCCPCASCCDVLMHCENDRPPQVNAYKQPHNGSLKTSCKMGVKVKAMKVLVIMIQYVLKLSPTVAV